MQEIVLAGDVGGSKTHLALVGPKGPRDWVADKKYKSSQFSNLRAIVLQFLKEYPDYQVKKACFGIAGPIEGRICRATNLPWVVDAALLEREACIGSVSLINDLEANAYGIDCLETKELFCLNEGKVMAGNRALIAAGTGLGESGIYWGGKRFHPFACEGGHCSFAPENDLEIRLLRYLMKLFGHASFERILSGPGLYNLYRFFVDEGIEKENAQVKAANEAHEAPKLITEMALQKSCPACVQAVELFVSIYGSEAANLALKMFAVGGVYVGGGIAPKILGCLKEGSFMQSFSQKGRFKKLLLDIPVHVILNENTALLGAAQYVQQGNDKRR